MNSPYASRYVELLTPAVVPVLSKAANLAPVRDDGGERVAHLRTELAWAIQAVDWEGVGLPMHFSMDSSNSITGSQRTSRQQAELLVDEAVTDCENLIEIGKAYRPDTLSDPDIFSAALKNSRHTLLAVSGLEDTNKRLVISSTKMPELAEYLFNLDENSTPVVQGHDASRQPRLEWRPEIKQWIDDRRGTDSGCPADKKMIKTSGGTIRLTHYLWNTVVDASYLGA